MSGCGGNAGRLIPACTSGLPARRSTPLACARGRSGLARNYASGEASPNRGPDARDRLTPPELSIAQLAAEGLTNCEIGHRLYLSYRTVSTHLHRIFPKLGISSRVDLGAALRPGAQQPSM